MNRKIIWIILCSALVFTIVSLAGSDRLNPVADDLAPTNQDQDSDNFSDFIAQKKKLSQAGGEVSFNLSTPTAFIWDKESNNFDRKTVSSVSSGVAQLQDAISNLVFADLNQNLVQESYNLENGRLTVTENEEIIWQSSNDWWVDSFVLADANNDGIIDLNLSIWRAGDFGKSKPFWVMENDMSIKNHLFVFDLVDGDFKAIWQSSNLEAPNCEFNFTDIDNDNKNDLIVIEGDYSRSPSCDGKYLAVWKWNGWGFSNDWRSEAGKYAGLRFEDDTMIVDSF